jgi:hypothetical protein
MTLAGLKTISRLIDLNLIKDGKLNIAPDILGTLRADELAWKNFQKLPEGYK